MNGSEQFEDNMSLYRFWFDASGMRSSSVAGNGVMTTDRVDFNEEPRPLSQAEQELADSELPEALATLAQMSPDAVFRLILKKE